MAAGSSSIESLFGVTLILSLLPIVVVVATSYVKTSIVIGTVRSALGVPHIPGGLAEAGLALLVSLVVMQPIITEVLVRVEADWSQAVGDASIPSATKGQQLGMVDTGDMLLSRMGRSLAPWRKFLSDHIGENELRLTTELLIENERGVAQSEAKTSGGSQGQDSLSLGESEELPLRYLVLAFLVTELRRGFLMALALLIPFLVVDLVVVTIMSAVGLSSANPMVVALPLKIAFFVLSDGWMLLIREVVLSYRVPVS